MKKKRLLFFTSSYPYGNSESFIENEIEFLANRYDEVIIFPFIINEDACRELPSNVRVVNHVAERDFKKCKFKRLPLLEKMTFIRFVVREMILSKDIKNNFLLMKDLGYIFATAIVIKENLTLFLKENYIHKDNTDVYSFWFDFHSMALALLVKSNAIKPFTTRVHGYDLFLERRMKRVIPFRFFQLQKVKKVFAVSNAGYEYLINNYPKSIDKFCLSRLGVFSIGVNKLKQNEVFTIVSCSNVIELKRVLEIPNILSKLSFKVKWIHFGDGILMEKLKEIVKILPSHVDVILKGHVPNQEVLNFYRTDSVNLSILLSRSEGGVPVSLQEAISFGIPVMGTNVGGISEVVNSITGVLLKENFMIEEVVNEIENFKSSEHSLPLSREKIIKFWSENFNAEINYNKFLDEF